MNERSYRYLLYLISVVITITLAIQVYWNYKNFKESERQLKTDLQTTLDQSVEDYFTLRAKNNTISFINNGDNEFGITEVFEQFDFEDLDENDELRFPDSVDIKGITILKGIHADTLPRFKVKSKNNLPEMLITDQKGKDSTSIRISNLKFEDEESVTEIQELTNRIVFSIKSDKLRVEKVDSIFRNQLQAKNISINHQLVYKTLDSTYQTIVHSFPGDTLISLSELIDDENKLELTYSGLNTNVLKRNLTGILLSTLLIASIILCLFYLLNIIKRQKNLNAMKNDLISNITHEFKTPIATTSAALEGVQNFTNSGDMEKTDRYLNMGREQLDKLNNMVEKLLETASLDGKELALQKGELVIADMIDVLVSKFKSQTSKSINFINHTSDSNFAGDGFHIENAFNNLIDNAIKYGGTNIQLELYKSAQQYELLVTDSGTGLTAKESKQIFNQFYRVPKGNVHDVKGFGIGLYYTKSIIEKHGGSITVATKPTTQFKIVLPYE
ncbi:sensor histidine kinase [Nonlabens ulvanivorans]|uniref:sensor histidine kinase n=1 Tax=Nonlabens ulvanivorans TaxID=906888 RepID=UPI0029429939|nr:HAMP domain-containing sensor histidine kinase [Nonlabens ulvanivorans]WOI21998.1 HAMP domain-containing sensor histidine kinase [Nonlabens ulvanivorans]